MPVKKKAEAPKTSPVSPKKYCLVDFAEHRVLTPLTMEELESELMECDDNDVDVTSDMFIVDLTTGKKYEPMILKSFKLELVD